MNPDSPSKPAESAASTLSLYRSEALAHRGRPSALVQTPLRVMASWERWTLWVTLGCLLAAAALLVLGSANQYASGPAFIRCDDRYDVSALREGTVAAVLVKPGDRVVAGQMLARFDDQAERALLEDQRRAFDKQLVRLLVDRRNVEAQGALVQLRQAIDHAQSTLRMATVVAPRPGVVADVWVRTGQRVPVGQVVLGLSNPAAFKLVAVLPGQFRPRLQAGSEVLLELNGYARAYQRLRIAEITEEVVGPEQIRRYLGPQLADTVAVNGPLLLVTAPFPSGTFQAGDHEYRLHDGMQGRAELLVSRERLAAILFPSLQNLL
jgi:biotin carboxyl carrier protein